MTTISSYIALLLAQVRDLPLPEDANFGDELHWINELVYHLNPSLRMGVKITTEERDKLLELTEAMQARSGGQGFVLPEGSEAAALAHIVRCKCKKLVRLTYRHLEAAGRGELTQEALEILIDVPNLLSGYFFGFALTLVNNRCPGSWRPSKS